MTKKQSVYERVTSVITAQLEQGVRPWARSWNDQAISRGLERPVRFNGQPYSGINVLILWSFQQERGYASNRWMTYRQAQELGGQVRKGEKSAPVVKVGQFAKTAEIDGEECVEHAGSYLKQYAVFNVAQIDGLPDRFLEGSQIKLAEHERIAAAEDFVSRTLARVVEGGNLACYMRSPVDEIRMPELGRFQTAESFYATLLHELAHWSGAEHRLNRTKGKQFGDSNYAFEELVAELGAAFLCADLQISAEPREDHAQYLSGWLKALQKDPRAIFTAAAQAERACSFLHGFQPATMKQVA